MKQPPRTTDHEGNPRTVGVEIEFTGLTLEEIATTVIATFGGEVEKGSRYQCSIVHHRFHDCGPIGIELDLSLLRDDRLGAKLGRLGIRPGTLADSIEEVVERSARQVVPMEIVAPPLPLARLPELEELRIALLTKAAQDTHSHWFYAFGLHLNPAVSSIDTADLRSVLQAFLLLYEWLVERLQVDRTRRLTPYIDPFPESYRKLVLDPAYDPVLTPLIDDYLEFNATRNRPLDLLPLFTWLDRDRVLATVDDGLTSARPTWHYRLPNCNIADPDWTFTREWDHWVVIENLAADRPLLEKLMVRWSDRHRHPLEHWRDQIRRTLSRWF